MELQTQVLAGWSDFFVAVAGASAALAGLIIVAMSVNIETIVSVRALPSRAGATVALLMLVVVVAILGLIPALPLATLGVIVGVLSLGALALAADTTVRELRDDVGQGVRKSSVIVLPALAFLVGGILLGLDIPVGLAVIAAAIVGAFIGAVLNAWVLLVEIRR